MHCRRSAELGLPTSQMLALFNKAIRKMGAALRAVEEASVGAALPGQGAADAAGSALRPMAGLSLGEELDAGAAESLRALRKEQERKQAEWLQEVEGGDELARYAVRGSDADWEAALGGAGGATGGRAPGHVSLKSDAPAKGKAKRPDEAHGLASGLEGVGEGRAKKHKKDGGKSPKRRKSF